MILAGRGPVKWRRPMWRPPRTLSATSVEAMYYGVEDGWELVKCRGFYWGELGIWNLGGKWNHGNHCRAQRAARSAAAAGPRLRRPSRPSLNLGPGHRAGWLTSGGQPPPPAAALVAACRDEGRGRRGCVEVARVPSALREFPLRKGSPQCTLTFFALSEVI